VQRRAGSDRGPLSFRADLYESVLGRFKHLPIQITENNKKQATLPEGAIAIENPNGTAPGVLVEDERGIVICMPGVPFELKAMMSDFVLPYLRGNFGLQGVLHYQVLKVCGMGESAVDDRIGDIIQACTNPSVGLLANPTAVRIRIAARADSLEAAKAAIAPVEAQIRERLAGLIMGTNDDTIEEVVDALLMGRGWRLSVAECYTGGMVAQRLTAARSQAFAGGRVWPVTELDGKTAVETAFDRADELLLTSEAESVLSIVADPARRVTAGVFVTPEGRAQWEVGHISTRERNQLRASIYALEQVRRYLAGRMETSEPSPGGER